VTGAVLGEKKCGAGF